MTAGVRTAGFLVPKRGNRAEECEDAWAVLVDRPLAADTVPDVAVEAGTVAVAAVADGASESLLARTWAGLLVENAVDVALKDPRVLETAEAFEEFAAASVAEWPGVVDAYTAERAERGLPLRWYEQPGLAKGAFATLVALRAEACTGPGAAADRWRWTAAALGDSCLFHVRDRAVIAAFPVTDADGFDTSPELFCSRAEDVGLVAARTRFTAGEARPGDRLLLATDALAAWLLAADADTAASWLRVVESYEDTGRHDGHSDGAHDEHAAAFVRLVENERASGTLRNDDVALVVVHFTGAPWQPQM